MRKLIQGIVDFRKSLTDEKRDLFAKLALGQAPDALFIACSDSRVTPNIFASTNPGDLFVVRNIGNLIPPNALSSADSSTAAAIEFALSSLNVANIIVCGHSECGAMQALCCGTDTLECPHLKAWLKYGEPSLKKIEKGITLNSKLSQHNQVSQINVLQQIEHIKTYPTVIERMKQGKLHIHGWWFDIAKADVYCYEETAGEFLLIDEEEANLILKRI